MMFKGLRSWREARPQSKRWKGLVLVFLFCSTGFVHGFDRKRKSTVREPRTDFSLLDDVLSGFSEFNDPNQSNARSLFRKLCFHGRKRSVSMVEGVGQNSYLCALRGGAEIGVVHLSHARSSTQLDLLARSFAVYLAWIVSFQAAFAGAFHRRDSLFEVRSGMPCPVYDV